MFREPTGAIPTGVSNSEVTSVPSSLNLSQDPSTDSKQLGQLLQQNAETLAYVEKQLVETRRSYALFAAPLTSLPNPTADTPTIGLTEGNANGIAQWSTDGKRSTLDVAARHANGESQEARGMRELESGQVASGSKTTTQSPSGTIPTVLNTASSFGRSSSNNVSFNASPSLLLYQRPKMMPSEEYVVDDNTHFRNITAASGFGKESFEVSLDANQSRLANNG